MKHKAVVLFLCGVLAFGLLFTGCGNKNEATSSSNNKSIQVMISIDYPSKSKKTDIQEFKFSVSEDCTVLQATELYGSLAGIPVLINTTNNLVFGINDVNQGDFSKKYHWSFTVDGKIRSEDPSIVKLKDSDSIQWKFGK